MPKLDDDVVVVGNEEQKKNESKYSINEVYNVKCWTVNHRKWKRIKCTGNYPEMFVLILWIVELYFMKCEVLICFYEKIDVNLWLYEHEYWSSPKSNRLISVCRNSWYNFSFRFQSKHILCAQFSNINDLLCDKTFHCRQKMNIFLAYRH